MGHGPTYSKNDGTEAHRHRFNASVRNLNAPDRPDIADDEGAKIVDIVRKPESDLGFVVVNEGATTTYGPNDMVLDNWGKVESWVAKSPVTSYGSSGIGFVNSGDIDALTIDAPIETHGLGARGFNLYDGALIAVDGSIRTAGGEDDSLVRGKVVHLKAHALSLKPGAEGRSIRVTGQVVATNEAISDFDFAAPITVIGRIEVGGKRIG